MTNKPTPLPLAPWAGGITRVGSFSGIVLHREGPFQVQLWICDPNSEIPDHSHPNVDSLQVYVGGQLELRLNGNVVIPRALIQEDSEGRSNFSGAHLRVRPTDTHGATIGPIGAAFVTFQHWLNGIVPDSVETNWSGDLLSETHIVKTHDSATLPE